MPVPKITESTLNETLRIFASENLKYCTDKEYANIMGGELTKIADEQPVLSEFLEKLIKDLYEQNVTVITLPQLIMYCYILMKTYSVQAQIDDIRLMLGNDNDN